MAQSENRFIIIEKDSFVANDMAEGLHAAFPYCKTFQYKNTADAMIESGRDTVFISKLSLDEIERSGLGVFARQTGSTIVVRHGIDSIKAVTARGWISLPSPFTSDDLDDLLDQLQEWKAAG